MIGWPFYARHVSDFWSGNVSSRHSVARPVQRWANDGSGFQGFPWCCSAWKLFSPLRLYRMCPVYWSPFPSRMCPVYWSSFATYSVEWLVLHGLRIPRIQSNDLSYMEQTNVIFRDILPYLCAHRRFPCNNTYIIHLESRLCRFAVASLRFLRSDELFQHHTSSSRSRKDCSHKRRHQGSR